MTCLDQVYVSRELHLYKLLSDSSLQDKYRNIIFRRDFLSPEG